MLKLGMHVDNWRHFDVSYEIPCQFARDHDIDYVEFGTIDGDYFVQALGYNPHIPLHTDPLKLRSYLDSLRLQVSQLDAAYPMSCPEGQYRGIGYTIRAIQFAKALGCPCVDTTDGASKLPGFTDKEQIGIIKYHLSQCVRVAENHKVVINVEPHGPFTTNPEILLEIVTHFKSPFIRINFDTGNTFISGQDPVKFLKQVRKYVTHVHCKDVSPQLAAAARGKDTGISASVVPIGGGANAENIARCIQLLKKHNWEGVFSIESDGEENVRDSVAWLRKQIEA